MSFDELAPLTCSASRESKAIVKLYLYIFVCQNTKGCVIIASDSNSRLGLLKAVAACRLQTNGKVNHLYCDSHSTHDKLGSGDEKLLLTRHQAHSQHKNYCERMVKNVRSYLPKLCAFNATEPNKLGSLCITDIMLLCLFTSIHLFQTLLQILLSGWVVKCQSFCSMNIPNLYT